MAASMLTEASGIRFRPSADRRTSAAERELICVFKVAAHRQAAGEARDAHSLRQQVGDVHRRRLARHGGVGRHAHLVHLAVHAREERGIRCGRDEDEEEIDAGPKESISMR